MISYDAIVTEVTARLGNRQDISARIGRWVNYAFFEILLNPRFSFYELDKGPVTFNTVASQAIYTVGVEIPVGDFWFILDMRDNTNTRRVRRVHYTEIDKITQTLGQPVRYYRYSNTFTLDPIPDAVYTIQIRYRNRPADFVSGSNLLLGTEWEEPIMQLATIKGFEALDQRAKALEQRQLLEAGLGTRMDIPTLESNDEEPTIQPTLLFPSY
jgi:hypothetical protein